MNFDIIGDIHGQFEKLVALLTQLGYRDSGGSWRHSDRTAIFVGDLIDRGAHQVATVELVRRMVDAGRARCILGNHEFNAIAWATPDPDQEGAFLRPHEKPGNLKQHKAFLADVVEGSARHQEIIRWFKTLPLWMDLGALRVVHACWDQGSVDYLQSNGLPSDGTLSDRLLVEGSRKGSAAYEAVEILCKGPEQRLPANLSFRDSEGQTRHDVRLAWWRSDLSTFRSAAHARPEVASEIPEIPLPGPWRSFSYQGPPVIFGHYWFTGQPRVLSTILACVDYSVAGKNGILAAYRWEGEAELRDEHLVWV